MELTFYKFATSMKGQQGVEIQIRFYCAKSSATFWTWLIIIEKRTELGPWHRLFFSLGSSQPRDWSALASYVSMSFSRLL